MPPRQFPQCLATGGIHVNVKQITIIHGRPCALALYNVRIGRQQTNDCAALANSASKTYASSPMAKAADEVLVSQFSMPSPAIGDGGPCSRLRCPSYRIPLVMECAPSDPIVDEIRAVKRAISAQFDDDIRR